MELCTVIGVLLLAFSALECAKLFDRRSRRDLAIIEGFVELIRYIRAQIDCYALPIDEILKRCDDDLLSRCGFKDNTRPRDLIEFFYAVQINDKAAKKTIFDFCSDFGRNYREEQLKRCDVSLLELERRRDSLRQNAKNSKKLNYTLWLSGAAALIILLL